MSTVTIMHKQDMRDDFVKGRELKRGKCKSLTQGTLDFGHMKALRPELRV